jgi:ABC-type uncharacterized transport system
MDGANMATDTIPPANRDMTATTFNPTWAIAWGGGMLIVLTLWLRAKFDDLSFLLIGAIGLLGAAVIAFAVWQMVQMIRQPPTLAAAAQRRTSAGLVCLVSGAIMIILAVALWFALGLAGFGEYVGLGLFGLATLASGKALLAANTPGDSQAWHKLRSNLGLIKMALVILGGSQLIAFAILAWWIKLGALWWPELLALACGGLFFLAAAFWLQLQSVTGELRTTQLRLFILVVGGVSGLIVTLMILFRIFLWRDRVFLGGLDVWLGEESWKIWLCAYVLFIGLGLMFGSLLLARADIHASALLRRGLYGYNAVFGGVMVLAILILANILFYILVPYTINWNRTTFSTLSPATKGLLASLKEPTTFIVLMPQNHPAAADLRIMLENCRIENSRLEIQNISPDLEPKKYLDLADRFKEIQPERSPFGLRLKRGVLIVYGKIPDDPNQPLPPHAFVPDDKIFEQKSDDPPGMPPQMRGRGKMTRVFKAEPEIMKELHHLSAGKQKRKLYVLQGDGELDINNQDAAVRATYNEPLSNQGMAKLVEKLKKDEYEVVGLKFTARLKKEENIVVAPEIGPDKKKEIPDDAFCVLIPGACEPMSKETLDALERYVDRGVHDDLGGRLMVFFDTIFDKKYTQLRTSGLEDFLKKYGVDVRPEYTILAQARDPRIAVTTVPARPETLLARQYLKEVVQFYSARVIKPLSATGRFKADSLFQLDPKELDFWAETSPLAFTNISNYAQTVRKNPEKYVPLLEPLPVAVTVTEGVGELAKPRMVVFGDTEFIMNDERVLQAYYDLVTSSLEWMAEKGGFIGPRPRESLSYNAPFAVDSTRLFIYPGLLMLFAIAGLGAGLWLVRRR